MKLTIEEVFGILPPDQTEVSNERTPDLGNITNPNWSSKMKQFQLGLQNDKETVLSNMVSDKANVGSLSYFLDFITSSQAQIFAFMLSVIEKILNKEK